MATPVSIAIKRDAAQARIQQASIELYQKYGMPGQLVFRTNKQPDIQAAMNLEDIADFLEMLVAQPVAPVRVPPAIVQTPTPAPKPAQHKA